MSFMTQQTIEPLRDTDFVEHEGAGINPDQRNETRAIQAQDAVVPTGVGKIVHCIQEPSRWIDHESILVNDWCKESYDSLDSAISSVICKAAKIGVVLLVRDIAGVSTITVNNIFTERFRKKRNSIVYD